MITAAMRVRSHEPGSDGWHEQRRMRLGGSEIAAVLGLSPWESRFSLWHRKAGLIAPQEDRPELEWGRRLEDVIRCKWYENHPEAQMAEAGTFVNVERPFMLASPDSLAAVGGDLQVVEIKTAHDRSSWGPSGGDADESVPVYYLTQTRWYLGCLGLDVAHVAVLIDGIDYREYTVRQNDDDLTLMVTEGQQFIDSLAANLRPEIGDHDETYRVIRELHPDIDKGEDHELDADMASAYLDTKTDLTAAEKAHKTARSQVLDALGNANYGTWQGVRICRRQSSAGNTPHLVSTRKDPRNGGPTTATNERQAS